MTLGARTNSSSAGPSLTSTPGSGVPTQPGTQSLGSVAVTTGAASVSP